LRNERRGTVGIRLTESEGARTENLDVEIILKEVMADR